MAKLIFVVAKKDDTFDDCIFIDPNTTYGDTILQNYVFTGQTPKSIVVTNRCKTGFTVPKQTLFTHMGLTASIDSIFVGDGATVSVPVIYNGSVSVLGTSSHPIRIGNSSSTYTLTVVEVDKPPVTSDNTIYLDNRVGTVVDKNSLIFSDPNGDTITHVRFTGNVAKLYRDAAFQVPYVSGTELPIDFQLFFQAPDVDTASTFTVDYSVKANGLWSN